MQKNNKGYKQLIGFFNINKPQGLSSAMVVAKVKRLCPKGTKVGHLGTLDPMASGVLPIAVGRATRLFDLMQNKQKTYIATFKFGFSTNTLDATGEIDNTTDVIPTKQQIESILPNFIGTIMQKPPNFSAKMINGKRAYDLARSGKEVSLKPCEVKIYNIKLLQQIKQDEFKFEITCGSGTYIRSLARDIAQCVNSLAYMTSLVRTKTGMFLLENAKDLNNLTTDDLIGLDKVLCEYTRFDISDEDLRLLLDGKKVKFSLHNGVYLIYNNNIVQVLVQIQDNEVINKIWLK